MVLYSKNPEWGEERWFLYKRKTGVGLQKWISKASQITPITLITHITPPKNSPLNIKKLGGLVVLGWSSLLYTKHTFICFLLGACVMVIQSKHIGVTPHIHL